MELYKKIFNITMAAAVCLSILVGTVACASSNQSSNPESNPVEASINDERGGDLEADAEPIEELNVVPDEDSNTGTNVEPEEAFMQQISAEELAELFATLTELGQPQLIVQFENADEIQSTLNSLMGTNLQSIAEMFDIAPIDDSLIEAGTQLVFSAVSTITELGISAIKVENVDLIHTVMSLLEEHSNVMIVEPNYIMSTMLPVSDVSTFCLAPEDRDTLQIPDNEFFYHQWSLLNTGQEIVTSEGSFVGVSGTDINVIPVWEAEHNLQEVIVAVIDSGIDTTHPNLAGRFLPGYDLIRNTSDMIECGGHGTAVASVIAANWGSTGMAGVAPNSTIIPLRFIDEFTGGGSTFDAIEAIYLAVEGGAQIINNSWGGHFPSLILWGVIELHPEVLFVNAAGNFGLPWASFPAGYPAENIISVAAIDKSGMLTSWTNHSLHVCIAAPGAMILTAAHGDHIFLDGTSFAAPIVAGAAALYLGMFPDASPSEIRRALMESATKTDELASGVIAGGYLNVAGAIEYGKSLR